MTAVVRYDAGHNVLRNEIFEKPIRYNNGLLDVPTGPGLGVTLDREALKRFRPA